MEVQAHFALKSCENPVPEDKSRLQNLNHKLDLVIKRIMDQIS